LHGITVLLVVCCWLRRTAAATYTSELHKAVAAVQREYSLPVPGSSRNVFTWRARPDVHAIADIMTKYIKEWDHNQVRTWVVIILVTHGK
jgi:hypothetical protein